MGALLLGPSLNPLPVILTAVIVLAGSPYRNVLWPKLHLSFDVRRQREAKAMSSVDLGPPLCLAPRQMAQANDVQPVLGHVCASLRLGQGFPPSWHGSLSKDVLPDLAHVPDGHVVSRLAERFL